MSGERRKAPDVTERSSLMQWMRNRWGCSLVLFCALVLLTVVLITSLPYAITHVNATDCVSLNGIFVADTSEAWQETQYFLSAHQHCEEATLAVLSQGIDSGGRVTIRTANSLGQCSLSVLGYAICMISLCNVAPFIDSDCSTLTQQEDGFHLAHCGTWPGDFPVPT